MTLRFRFQPMTLLVCVAVAFASAANPALALQEGEVAPVFTANALQGSGKLSLASYRGKVVYLDFWASWCGPCLVSLPILEDIRQEFSADELQVVAVNVDSDAAKGRQFLSRLAVGYPSATDPEGQIPERYGVTTMPTSFLIDRQGVVRYVHKGFRKADAPELKTRIRELVEGN